MARKPHPLTHITRRTFAIARDHRVTRRWFWLVLAGLETDAEILDHGFELTRELAVARARESAGPDAIELSARLARRRRRDAIGDRRFLSTRRSAPSTALRRAA